MVDKAKVQNINIALETIVGKKIDKRVLYQVFSLKTPMNMQKIY